jgi:hypothetical protein
LIGLIDGLIKHYHLLQLKNLNLQVKDWILGLEIL